MSITFEQAMGLYENVRMTETGFQAVFEYFCNPKNKFNSETILSHWDNAKSNEIQVLMNKLRLEKAYKESL